MNGEATPYKFEILQPASCDECGLCCLGIGSPVLLYQTRSNEPEPHPFRPADLPESLIQEIDANFAGLSRGQEPLEQCLWYDTVAHSCKHYQWRPALCHEYELGGAECLRLRKPFTKQ